MPVSLARNSLYRVGKVHEIKIIITASNTAQGAYTIFPHTEVTIGIFSKVHAINTDFSSFFPIHGRNWVKNKEIQNLGLIQPFKVCYCFKTVGYHVLTMDVDVTQLSGATKMSVSFSWHQRRCGMITNYVSLFLIYLQPDGVHL